MNFPNLELDLNFKMEKQLLQQTPLQSYQTDHSSMWDSELIWESILKHLLENLVEWNKDLRMMYSTAWSGYLSWDSWYSKAKEFK